MVDMRLEKGDRFCVQQDGRTAVYGIVLGDGDSLIFNGDERNGYTRVKGSTPADAMPIVDPFAPPFVIKFALDSVYQAIT